MRATANSAALLLLLLVPDLVLADGKDPRPTDPPAAGPASISLSYRFSRLVGKVAVYRIQNEISQSTKIRGKSGKKDQRQRSGGKATSLTRQTYEVHFERVRRGIGRVRITPTRIYAKVVDPEKTYSYDSKKGRAPPKRLAALTQTLNRTAVLDVTRHGVVRAIRGVKSTLRKAYRENFHRLPQHRLTVGRGWEQKKKQPIPPFGNLHYFTSFRLTRLLPPKDGRGPRRKVEAKIFITYEGVGPQANTKLAITSQSGGGHLLFNENGLLMEEKLHSEVVYTIKAPAGTEVHTVTSKTSRWLSSLKDAAGKEKERD